MRNQPALFQNGGHMLRQETPLATAAWERGAASLRPYAQGQFFLGFHPDGNALGIADDRHVLLVAGPRTGKGASVLIPNLCLYPGSVVMVDPKGENAIVTARARANGSRYCEGRGQKVVLLDPFHTVQTPEDRFEDLRGGFNPLDMVDAARPDTIGDAARIADAIVVSEQSKDPYWEESARGLIKAVILHVASSADYPREARNLVTVWRLVMAGDVKRQAIAALMGGKKNNAGALALLFKAMAHNKAFGGAVAQAGVMFGDLEAKASRTMANIAQIASSNLEFIENPEMQRCLSRSDIALSELKSDPRGVSLYLSLPQAYMGTHYRWLRMVTTLLVAEMERHRYQPRSGHRVLLMLDEFAALRRMKVMEDAAAQIAGFGVRMVFAVQTLAQLRDVYKDNWETLIATSGVKMFFGNDDHFTREYVSKLIGETEITRILTTVSETTGTSTSSARGVTSGSTLTSTWGLSHTTNGASSNTGGSHADTSSWTTTKTDGTTTSRTVADAQSLHKRALLTPDEVGRLFGNRAAPVALTIVSGHQPLALTRKPYFRMEGLKGFYDWHPDHARPEPIAARRAQRLAQDRAAREQDERQRREQQAQWERQKLIDERNRQRREIEEAAEAYRALWRRRAAVLGKGGLAILVTWSVWSVSTLLGSPMLIPPTLVKQAERPRQRSITGHHWRVQAPHPAWIGLRLATIIALGVAAHLANADLAAKNGHQAWDSQGYSRGGDN